MLGLMWMEYLSSLYECAVVRATGKTRRDRRFSSAPESDGLCSPKFGCHLRTEERSFTHFYPSIGPADIDQSRPWVSFPLRESLLYSRPVIVPGFSGVTFILRSTIRPARLIDGVPSRALSACRGAQGAKRSCNPCDQSSRCKHVRVSCYPATATVSTLLDRRDATSIMRCFSVS